MQNWNSDQHKNSQRGNALFLILIAVALFAALSYAITGSDRGGTSISREQALIDAGLEQDCTARVEQAVLRLKTLYGCTDTTISYENNDVNVNDDAPADKSCNIFDPAGGGEVACGSYLVEGCGGSCGGGGGGDLYYNGGGFSTGSGHTITLPNFLNILNAAIAAYHAQYNSYPADLSSGAGGGGCCPAVDSGGCQGVTAVRPCFDAVIKDGGTDFTVASGTWDITGSRRYCHHNAADNGAYDKCYSYDSGTGAFTDRGTAPD